jgi:hypothetical protein
MADGQLQIDQETGDILVMGTPPVQPESADSDHFENLAARVIAQETLDRLTLDVIERVEADEQARTAFIEQMARNSRLLGIGGESDADDGSEYENADTSDHPLLLTSLLRFTSKALSSIMPAPDNVARAVPAMNFDLIEDDEQREEMRAQTDGSVRRVQAFYNEYLLRSDQPYREDFDSLLFQCGLHGTGLRKVYNDPTRKRNRTRVEWVPVQDLIIAYSTASMTRGRISHRIEMPTTDLIRGLRSGVYVGGDMISTPGSVPTPDELTLQEDELAGIARSTASGAVHPIYEIHTHLYIKEDMHPLGLARPYIVTVHVDSQQILSIKRNWQPYDPDEIPIETFVAYLYAPGKRAVQGMGLGQIIGNVTKALRSMQRAGIEAAKLQNLPFGFKLGSMKIRNDSGKVTPGMFLDVDTPTDDIRKAVQVFQFNGTSPGLIQLMQMLEQNGKELGGVASIDFAQLMKAGIAAGPAMAAFEESTEFQTAVHRRLYDGHATELRLLHDRMQEAVGASGVSFGDGEMLRPGDLKKVKLLPIMRPGHASRQKSMLEAQALLEAANMMPDVVDKRKAAEQYLRALGREDIDDFMLPEPTPEDVQPLDPATEYGSVLQGRPIRAGLAQDHRAHIETHIAQLQLLQTAQLPVEQGEAAMAVLSAHIAEHHAMDMIVQVASRMGLPLEMFIEGIPPEVEAQIAPEIAKITAQLEAERRPSEEKGDDRVAVERLKAEAAMQKETLSQRHEREMAELKHRQVMELQAQKDEAALDRALQDDATALEIARTTGSKSQSAGTRSS